MGGRESSELLNGLAPNADWFNFLLILLDDVEHFTVYLFQIVTSNTFLRIGKVLTFFILLLNKIFLPKITTP